MSRYQFEYDNDTGPGDDGFHEWWEIYDGTEYIGRAYTEAAAAKICAALNRYDTSPPEKVEG